MDIRSPEDVCTIVLLYYSSSLLYWSFPCLENPAATLKCFLGNLSKVTCKIALNSGLEAVQIKCIVCTPILSAGEEGGGVEPPTKFSKRGGLRGLQLWERGCWKRRGNFFQGREVAILLKKIKWNLKYLMTKKVYKQKYFSLS